MARVGSANFKITKMAGYMPKRLIWLMNRMKKFKEFCRKRMLGTQRSQQNFLFKPSEICKQPKKAWKILKKHWQGFFANYFVMFCMNIFFRYNISLFYRPSARGIRRNISFSDNIITSGNISPNPPRSGSINEKKTTYMCILWNIK